MFEAACIFIVVSFANYLETPWIVV